MLPVVYPFVKLTNLQAAQSLFCFKSFVSTRAPNHATGWAESPLQDMVKVYTVKRKYVQFQNIACLQGNASFYDCVHLPFSPGRSAGCNGPIPDTAVPLGFSVPPPLITVTFQITATHVSVPLNSLTPPFSITFFFLILLQCLTILWRFPLPRKLQQHWSHYFEQIRTQGSTLVWAHRWRLIRHPLSLSFYLMPAYWLLCSEYLHPFQLQMVMS